MPERPPALSLSPAEMTRWVVMFLLGLILAGCAAKPAGDIIQIDHATLSSRAGSRPVDLPNILAADDFPPTGGRVRYRLEVLLPSLPDEPLGIYVPKLSLSGAISLNGVRFGTCGPGPLEALRCLHQPQWFVPPENLWHEGTNLIVFEIYANDRQMNGLSPVRVGPAHALYASDFLPRWLWRVELLHSMSWLAAWLGLLALIIHRFLRGEDVFLWFGLGSLMNALSNLNILITAPPISIEWFSWFVFSTRMVSTPLALGLLLSFFNRLSPRIRLCLWACAFITPLIIWLSHSNRAVVSLLYVPVLLALLFVCLASVRWAWHSYDRLAKILSGMTLGLMAVSILDWLRLTGHSSFDGVYNITYAFTAFMVVFGGLMMVRLASALLAERTLNRKLELATRSAHAGFWDLDLTTHQTNWSREMMSVFGLHPEEAGESFDAWSAWRSTVHPDDLPEAERKAMDAMSKRQSLEMNYRIVKPDGQLRWIETRADVHLDERGHPTLSGIALDVTDRTETEIALDEHRRYLEDRVKERTGQLEAANRQLQIKERTKSIFLANMSHEIRTPLGGIIGMVEIARSLTRDEAAQNYLSKAEASARSLLQIINDILDFSKIEADKLPIERIPTHLGELMERVRQLVNTSAIQKTLSFSVEIETASNSYFFGDPLRIQQILLNLLGNAIKFTALGSVELVVYRPASERLRFEVHDTGIGIAPELIDHVFDSFRQADGSVSRRYGGSGLGLTISKQLVALMGGNIGVDSHPGMGSCFYFEIPAEPCAAPSIRSDAAKARDIDPPSLANLAGLRVLLADDNDINREYAVWVLEQHGLVVDQAINGEQAVERFKATLPHLILMDLQMPVMDGFEATRRIRKLDATVPIVALTANAFREDVSQVLAADMNEHLSKPVVAKQLMRVVARYLRPADHPAMPTHQLRPAADTDWPEIDGIDRSHARRALEGNRALFLRLLPLFIEQQGAELARIREDWSADARKDAARRLHSLRGGAAQIGALDVCRAALAAEEAVKGSSADAEALLQALTREFERLARAWGAWAE